MIKAVDLIALWRQALADGWGYIWGTSGEMWTSAKQRAATRETTIKYGSKWIGHRVSDCSGLAYWAFRQLGGTMYHGSNTIWNQYVTGRCELKDGKRTDGEPMLPGDPVFLVEMKGGEKNRHHIGYWCGDAVIEAKSTYYGVVTSPLTQWHETAHWANVEYEGGQVFVNHPTLCKGDSGESVTYLQTLLCSVGDPITVDGKFGSGTEKAVKDFQKANGLTVDGVVGPKTWDALEKATGHHGDEEAGSSSGCLSFGEAISAAKNGKRIQRSGWNGKNQYVELASCISYKNPLGEVVNADHKAIGNQAFAFVGTSGVQVGWLASQADMLANDWQIVAR